MGSLVKKSKNPSLLVSDTARRERQRRECVKEESEKTNLRLQSSSSSSSNIQLTRCIDRTFVVVVKHLVDSKHQSNLRLQSYISAAISGFREPQRRAISIEVGMQNSSLGVVLATSHFASPMVALPPAMSAVLMNIMGKGREKRKTGREDDWTTPAWKWIQSTMVKSSDTDDEDEPFSTMIGLGAPPLFDAFECLEHTPAHFFLSSHTSILLFLYSAILYYGWVLLKTGMGGRSLGPMET
ncbi:hypothetical protein TEA_000546 [Camellia sinensis var. sinensis]|uniref:Uncharacterized protein n=1 Tax=Camellia sinensis var. sinensis TaxID=542762 RepID=A0A4S4DF20_CAMSN|nr:hypothetical protein TEA_000546 [Camellia sinensis var. sinensis]